MLLHTTTLLSSLSLTFLLSTLPTFSHAQANEPKPDMKTIPNIKSISYSGSGCPSANTMFFRVTQAPDRNDYNYPRDLHFNLEDFTPWIGPGTKAADRRRVCDVSIGLEIDPGWRISANVNGTVMQGYARLGLPTSNMDVFIEYAWSGNVNVKSRSQTRITGPLVGRFIAHAPVVGLPVVGFPGPGVDSACGGGVLNVKHDSRLSEAKPTDGSAEDMYDTSRDWIFTSPIKLVKC